MTDDRWEYSAQVLMELSGVAGDSSSYDGMDALVAGDRNTIKNSHGMAPVLRRHAVRCSVDVRAVSTPPSAPPSCRRMPGTMMATS